MKITVQKKNIAEEVTWQYEGVVLSQAVDHIVLEAFFNRPDTPFMDTVLKERDRFVETFFNDRWYNIFEIYDRDDGQLKGWYCNIGKPAVIETGLVSYVDLALDLWINPAGQQAVLDEDEFQALGLSADLATQARTGLAELQQLFKRKRPPST